MGLAVLDGVVAFVDLTDELEFVLGGEELAVEEIVLRGPRISVRISEKGRMETLTSVTSEGSTSD